MIVKCKRVLYDLYSRNDEKLEDIYFNTSNPNIAWFKVVAPDNTDYLEVHITMGDGSAAMPVVIIDGIGILEYLKGKDYAEV